MTKQAFIGGANVGLQTVLYTVQVSTCTLTVVQVYFRKWFLVMLSMQPNSLPS